MIVTKKRTGRHILQLKINLAFLYLIFFIYRLTYTAIPIYLRWADIERSIGLDDQSVHLMFLLRGSKQETLNKTK